jgi:DNA polymerase-3 subunit gamma/tau
MDVIEMDAASNNGVDDIRDIREHVKFPPSQVKYKVYIIDEVHMLSKGAFNALLKTLEEPPAHVLFLLATTELHKVPATILSRCQRYDFRRIPEPLMAKRLAFICAEEKYPITDEAIQLIVKYSEGALRDAQSLLNQCMSFAPLGLDYASAVDALGKAKDQAFEDLFQSIIDKDVPLMLQTIADLTEDGKDLNLFLEDCIDKLRQVLLSHMLGTDATPEGAAVAIPVAYLLTMIEALAKCGQDMKWSNAPRVIFEVCWIRLIKPELTMTLDGLSQRIEALENGQGPVVGVKQTQQGHAVYESTPVTTSTSVVQPIAHKKENQGHPIVERAESKGSVKVSQPESVPIQTAGVLPTDVTFTVIKEQWGKVLEAVRQELKTTHALLKETTLTALSGNEVHVAFSADMAILSGGLEKEENRRLIDAKLELIYGVPLKLKVISPLEVKEKKPKEDQLNDFLSGFEDKIIMK